MVLEQANSIPIFDTLSHPTLNGNWLHPRYDGQAIVGDMLLQMQEQNIIGAFAVGMKGVGNYEEDEYIRMCGGVNSCL